MRRLIVLMGLVGCSADGGDDQPGVRPPGGQDDEDVAKDRKECEPENTAAKCPLGWGWSVRNGPPEDEGFVELEDVARPLCNGQGLYAEPEDFAGAPAGPEVTVVRNTQCTAVCFPQCGFTSVCYAENPNGRACGDACSGPGLAEDECVAFVAECLGEEPTVCEDPPR